MFLKMHPVFVRLFWLCMRALLKVCSIFLPVKKKTILFCSFGGRKFDDSPKSIYDRFCMMPEFNDWKVTWAFVEPDEFSLKRGEKVKIDTVRFFKALLYSQVWVSNSDLDRGIDFYRSGTIQIETWHGTPLKKICGEENTNSIGGRKSLKRKKIDSSTIRCAQSEYDREIFERVFYAKKEAILLSDLPKNDALLRYTTDRITQIKEKLQIPFNKRIILYMPTYREYLVDGDNRCYIKPPMDLSMWKRELGSEYVMLIRAHYAVTAALDIGEDSFAIDVSNYPTLNDLYAVADVMISDYSSSFFDYSILDRPMLCFAYDKEEYEEKRGLYMDLEDTLPCKIDRTENEVLSHLKTMNYEVEAQKAKEFHYRFAPYAGNATETVIAELKNRLGMK